MSNFPDKRQPVSERFHRIVILLSIPEEIGNGDIEPRSDARGKSRRVWEVREEPSYRKSVIRSQDEAIAHHYLR
jgi:hypothetical protein